MNLNERKKSESNEKNEEMKEQLENIKDAYVNEKIENKNLKYRINYQKELICAYERQNRNVKKLENKYYSIISGTFVYRLSTTIIRAIQSQVFCKDFIDFLGGAYFIYWKILKFIIGISKEVGRISFFIENVVIRNIICSILMIVCSGILVSSIIFVLIFFIHRYKNDVFCIMRKRESIVTLIYGFACIVFFSNQVKSVFCVNLIVLYMLGVIGFIFIKIDLR